MLAFGNSPPQIPLEKVKDGRQKFEKILHQDQTKEELVDNLMELLQDRSRYAGKCHNFYLKQFNYCIDLYVQILGTGRTMNCTKEHRIGENN